MTMTDFTMRYNSAMSVNYDTNFVTDQLDILQEMKETECESVRDEVMALTIICSALKYYLEASPEGYGAEIINITERLEAIYNIEGLLEELLEVTT